LSFEIRERDVLGRIGRLVTKSGAIETPLLLPVVNPGVQLISPAEMRESFGCEAVITNAYILRRNFSERVARAGVHGFLDFPGVVMTDSGAYQILVYGGVEVTADEIARFQESIGTDIAVILDIPTGWGVRRERAESTVNETLRRARTTLDGRSRDDILWVGPVQGGAYLDLVARSAHEIGRLPFQIHALGSPTRVMEQYLFDTLADMIVTAKMSLPPERPLHLFGAGHPMVFALAVALGCDLFDSAAYAIYARQGRYMTNRGTVRLSQLEYLPCSCSVCSKWSPAGLRGLPKEQREALLARHNLHVCMAAIREIKQSIFEGRLWELLGYFTHGHPSLLRALRSLKRYSGYVEENSPITGRKGLFYFGSADLSRPAIVRHERRMRENYRPSPQTRGLLLLPQVGRRPFHTSPEHRKVLAAMRETPAQRQVEVSVCTYAAPFGVVPWEIDDVYPLSQIEMALPVDRETREYVAQQVAAYLESNAFEVVVLHLDGGLLGGEVAEACREVCLRKGSRFVLSVNDEDPWSDDSITKLIDALLSNLDNLS
jgi:7-cyano-7-deazaguanine tRNA-ribosyltransferase